MESIDQLNSYTPRQFEQWLELRLRTQHGSDSRLTYRAFDFRSLGIPPGESHIDSLVGLFARLSQDAQNNFRDALEQLLRHVEPGDFPRHGVADIILLVGLTKAHFAFKAFVPVIGSGAWGELHPQLVYDVLSVLLTFSRSAEAYIATRGLATSKNFREFLTIDAYLSMIRSQPESWAADLSLLRERFFALRRSVREAQHAKQIQELHQRTKELCRALVEEVPLSVLSQEMPSLKLTLNADAREAADNWVIEELFSVKGPLRMEYGEDGGSLVIIDDSDRARTCIVPGAPSFEVFCLSRHLVSIPTSTEGNYRDHNDTGIIRILMTAAAPGLADRWNIQHDAGLK